MLRLNLFILFAYFFLVGWAGDSIMVHAQDPEDHDSEDSHALEHTDGDSLTLDSTTLSEHGVVIERAQAKALSLRFALNGRLRANEDRLVHLTPRFGGIIEDVSRQLGDEVKKGDLLATVESNQNLQHYEVRAPIAGVIVKRHASLGELVKEDDEIFEIADLSELWADLYVFPEDFTKVRAGQEVSITANGAKVSSVISLVSAYVDPATQSKVARAVVKNPERNLYPGQFIRGEIIEGNQEVQVAVKSSAIQRWEGNSVVFVPLVGKVAPKVVVLGLTDSDYTEIRSGLDQRDEYYSGNVFVLKAELGKALASHDH